MNVKEITDSLPPLLSELIEAHRDHGHALNEMSNAILVTERTLEKEGVRVIAEVELLDQAGKLRWGPCIPGQHPDDHLILTAPQSLSRAEQGAWRLHVTRNAWSDRWLTDMRPLIELPVNERLDAYEKLPELLRVIYGERRRARTVANMVNFSLSRTSYSSIADDDVPF